MILVDGAYGERQYDTKFSHTYADSLTIVLTLRCGSVPDSIYPITNALDTPKKLTASTVVNFWSVRANMKARPCLIRPSN